MTEPLYTPVPGQPPMWLRLSDPERVARHVALLDALVKLCAELQAARDEFDRTKKETKP